MERLKELISQLMEQFDRKAEPTQMLQTAQLLEAELRLLATQPAPGHVMPTKIAVMMPSAARISPSPAEVPQKVVPVVASPAAQVPVPVANGGPVTNGVPVVNGVPATNGRSGCRHRMALPSPRPLPVAKSPSAASGPSTPLPRSRSTDSHSPRKVGRSTISSVAMDPPSTKNSNPTSSTSAPPSMTPRSAI